MSNGIFKSPVHRVVTNGEKDYAAGFYGTLSGGTMVIDTLKN